MEDGQEFGRAGGGVSLTFWADVSQSRGAGEARVGHKGGRDGRCPGNRSPIGLNSGAQQGGQFVSWCCRDKV